MKPPLWLVNILLFALLWAGVLVHDTGHPKAGWCLIVLDAVLAIVTLNYYVRPRQTP